MPTLFIKCPKTGRPTSTGIGVSKEGFNSNNLKGNSTQCQACGSMHKWDGKDAFFIE